MLVLLNVGPRAGQIQDIEPSAARQMITDGRAEVPQYDQGSAEPEGVAKLASVAADSAIQPDSAKSAKSAKKK